MRKTRIEKLQAKYPLLTKEKLNELYIDQQKSLPVIHKEYHIDFKACSDLLKYYGIQIRNISQSRLTPTAKEKIANSLKEKYGVSNVSQIDWVQKKKEETFKKHYGVDNIWKTEGYGDWLNDYMLLHYGVKRVSTNGWGWKGAGQKRKSERIKKLWDGRDKWWASLTDEEKSRIGAYRCSLNKFQSKLESRIENALDNLHIKYERQFFIGEKLYDFRIGNFIIEVNGDFWHANPKIFSADDVVDYPKGGIKASILWEKDRKKGLTAEAKGYTMITIWETDLIAMTDKDVEIWLIEKFKL